MLMIRLQRIGRKHEPAFRLVLTDSKNSTKSGKFLEILGNYDSRRGEKAEFKSDRINHWISVGAQTSITVHNLLIDKKIISAKKINKLPKKSPPKVEAVEEPKVAPVEAEVKAEEVAPAEVVAEEAVVEVAPVEETPVVEESAEVVEATA